MHPYDVQGRKKLLDEHSAELRSSYGATRPRLRAAAGRVLVAAGTRLERSGECRSARPRTRVA